MTSSSPTLLWLRRDLRLDDQPALAAAVARTAESGGGPVLPVFLWAPHEQGAWPPGAATRWWLDAGLRALAAALEECGSLLVIRAVGPKESSLAALRDLARETGACAVYWNRLYEPWAVARDAVIKQALRADGLDARSFNGAALFEPGTVLTGAGQPYKVFTPYWRACLASGEPDASLPPPPDGALKLPAALRKLASDSINSLGLLPTIDWASGMREAWTPGEAGAQALLASFIDAGEAVGGVGAYLAARDTPSVAGTSRLSPHLHFGEIGPRRLWHTVRARFASDRRHASKAGESAAQSAEGWLRQLVWREFALQLLFHFPATSEEPLRPEYAHFPWRDDTAALRAWQRGRTGYPIVDAGMRELWTTGWMHNRVRMIVASFLVKDLLLPWQEGARWFWDTLVDADLPNNTLGWQWAAGCGADAAPYFRVFNPVRQGEKFDPRGDYVRRWVPELAALPDATIHQPWTADAIALGEAGIALGRDYPEPIVDHAAARTRALAALAAMKRER